MEKGGFSERPNPTPWVRAFKCNVSYVTHFHSMHIPVSIQTSLQKANTNTLVDSGATDNFIHPMYVKRLGLGMKRLEHPQKIRNVDDTFNRARLITHCIDLDVETKGIHKEMRFLVTNIGVENIILGYPWLTTYKPRFSWCYGVIKEDMLPIFLHTVNPQIEQIPFQSDKELSRVNTMTTKEEIVAELEEQVRTAMVEDEDLYI